MGGFPAFLVDHADEFPNLKTFQGPIAEPSLPQLLHAWDPAGQRDTPADTQAGATPTTGAGLKDLSRENFFGIFGNMPKNSQNWECFWVFFCVFGNFLPHSFPPDRPFRLTKRTPDSSPGERGAGQQGGLRSAFRARR